MKKKLSDERVEGVALSVSLAGIAEVAREGLMALCVSTGLAVLDAMLQAEMAERVGAVKHAKTTERGGYWHRRRAVWCWGLVRCRCAGRVAARSTAGRSNWRLIGCWRIVTRSRRS